MGPAVAQPFLAHSCPLRFGCYGFGEGWRSFSGQRRGFDPRNRLSCCGGGALGASVAGTTKRGAAMVTGTKRILVSAVLLLVPYFAPVAFAHHLMGGKVPDTAWQGLLSGLGHPIIGVDHFAFIVGVGCMSRIVGQVTLLPLLFIIGSVLGCCVHVLGYTIPWSELAIALTLALAAAVVGTRSRAPIGALSAGLIVARAAHGCACGGSIVG